jgi:hypothetical protein
MNFCIGQRVAIKKDSPYFQMRKGDKFTITEVVDLFGLVVGIRDNGRHVALSEVDIAVADMENE